MLSNIALRFMNELTINELKDKLAQLDELTILELLDISSEELVEFLTDQIVEKYDDIIGQFQDEEDGFSD
jgi:hypothetical protein